MTVFEARSWTPGWLVAVVVTATVGHAADDSLYTTKIKAVFKTRCYACHGSLKQEAGLRLDTGQSVRQGGDSGPVVNAKSVNTSLLIQKLTAADDQERMPPIGKPLETDEIEAIRRWIAAGSPSPAKESPEEDPRDHWAFRRPVRPELPPVTRRGWDLNAVDRFISARHHQHRLTPVAQADPAILLRRVYLDLVGLPPTTRQLAEFLADPSQAHYERVVERLLASPRYGERWGRHWMDVWRYSDWYGRRKVNDVRNSAPQIWRWRDWIIDSLNRDKSYKRMIHEMLAADELAPQDDSAWPATGYLIRNYFSLNPNDWMRDSIEYTGKAFLGLTFNCAHCHDHKYDPITHDDYFRMRAFFEPMGVRQDRVPGEPDPPPYPPYVYSGSRKVTRLGMVRIFDERPDAVTFFYSGGDERNKDKQRGTIAPGVPRFLEEVFPPIEPVTLPMEGWYPGSRRNIQQAELIEHRNAVAAARSTLAAVLARPARDASALEKRLAATRKRLDEAVAKAVAAGEAGALVGKQSLFIDATTGRRIVQNTLPGLKAIPQGTTLSFQLKLLADNNANFQLAKDTQKGLTALFLGFVRGKIRGYHPGGYSEFTLASYDLAAGQSHFHVKLVFEPAADRVLVTIRLDGQEADLVSAVPIALNGWNPTKHPTQPFTFDCRTGSKYLVDEVKLVAGDQVFSWGFESPAFRDGADVVGIQGWTIHPQSQPAALSVVSMIAGCESARDAYTVYKQAEAALESGRLDEQVARDGLAARLLKLESVEATVLADNAKRDNSDAATIKALSLAAYKKQLEAEIAMADWELLEARWQGGIATALPEDDKQKATRVKKYETQRANAAKRKTAATARQGKTPESTEYAKLSRVSSNTSTGRRSSLARWIGNDRNPLTARVAVNHIWMRHFHVPLVSSVYDLGRNGKKPTHPQLLDWLAVELVEHDWSMKRLHRLMVTSRAYQMSDQLAGPKAAMAHNMASDKDNIWGWRRHRGRMEAEVIRDSVLRLAGRLDTTVGGQVLLNTTALSTGRRGMYYELYPEAGGNTAFAEVFDPPDPGECFRRSSTVVPQQALALINSQLVQLATKGAAQQVTGTTPEAFIKQAFLHVLSRPASAEEVEACQAFWTQQMAETKSVERVRESLVRVLFNHNDFVTIR